MIAGAVSAAGVALAGAAYGTFHRNSPLFGRALHRLTGADADRLVALTFDDGPNPRSTPLILDTLEAERVPATFFVLGKHADRWPDLVRREHDQGHEVGNHGWHHRRLHFAGPARATDDLTLGARSIERAGGGRPRFFRAPHGFRSPFVSAAARSLGERTVGWTYGVWDTDRPGAAEIARRTIEAARTGAIILLHDADGYDPEGDRMQTAEALPAIIHGLRERGFHFARL